MKKTLVTLCIAILTAQIALAQGSNDAEQYRAAAEQGNAKAVEVLQLMDSQQQ